MRLSFLSVVVFFVFLCLSGCDINAIGPYYNLGRFQTRIIAENKALAYMASRYDKLSSTDYEKVSYNFDQLTPVTRSQHAVWYSKADQELKLEVDLGSGTCATWKGISKEVLFQLAVGTKGFVSADSLGQSTGRGYRDCIGN